MTAASQPADGVFAPERDGEVVDDRARLPALDGVRGLAALLVVMLHLTMQIKDPSGAGAFILKKVGLVGWTGVDLFFVLSGFLITGILDDAKGSSNYFRVFYARRMLRILPLYYGALLVLFVMPHLVSAPGAPRFFVSIKDQLWYWFYLQNFHPLPPPFVGLAGHFWSLAVEEQFYLVWPLVIFLLSRKKALRLCIFLLPFSIAYRALIHIVNPVFASQLDGLTVGSAVALLYRTPGAMDWIKRRLPLLTAGSAAGIAAIYAADSPSIKRALLRTFLALLFGCLLVYAVELRKGLFARFLRSKVTRFFGRYSYGMYVLHVPIIAIAYLVGITPPRLRFFGSELMGVLIYIVLMVAASTGAAWVSYNIYEKHFLRFKRHFAYRRPLNAVALALVIIGAGPAARSAGAQTGSVSGIVSESATGRPLEGARVSRSGSSIATITDRNGRYRISGSFSGDVAIRVILLGYAPAEKRVSAATIGMPVNFELVPRALGLDEVVVTGSAGPTRVREIGHSIAQIDPARIPEPIVSMDNMLAGKVPGLVVVQNSAMAGSAAQIRLRGVTSVSLSNQPLIYVDGVRIRSDGYPKNLPRTGVANRGSGDVPSPLNDIDPDDVERVEVVRGPAATTLYGTEAATGVIQIFTKRGITGKPLWSSRIVFGADRVQKFGTAAEPYMRIDPWLKTARRMDYSLSTGGGDLLRYYVSGRYDRNEGVLPNDLEKRLVLRGNFDFAPADRLTLAWSSSVTKNDITNPPAGFNAQGLTFNAYRGDKNFTGTPGKESIDRILSWDITSALVHLIGGMTATYRASETMSHSVTIGYDRAEDEMRSLRPYGFVFAPQGILWNDRWSSSTVTADYLGRSGFHLGRVNGTLAWGAQTIRNDVSSVAGYAEGFPGPGPVTLSSGALTLAFENRARGITSGAFSQVVFDLRNRYFLTAGIRFDGSSTFGREFGLQSYPRLSASYVISDEPFWPHALGQVKLRAAYGYAGRSPRTSDAVRTWSPTGYEGKPAFLPLTIGNSHLGPERTGETEFGFDAGSPQSRLRADFTVYRRRTRDALLPVTQPPSLGFTGTQLQNVGTLLNTGAELALTGSIFRGSTITLDAGLDVALSHSRVVTLGDAASFIIDQTAWVIAGQPMLLLRGPLVTNPTEIAEPLIEKDHVFGPNFPTRDIGAHGTLGVGRGIELAARVEYSGGNYVFDQASNNLARQGAWPVCDDAYKSIAAGQRNTLTAWQRLWCNPLTAPRDGSIYPADFIRLRAVTLTVPLPGSFFHTRRGSVALSARNYLLWKKKDFLVFDPEMVGFDGVDATVRQIEMHVPAPVGFSLAISTSYW